MRNILQYPITHEEIIQTLQRMQDDISKNIDGPVGSMDGVILQEVERRLTQTIFFLETIPGDELDVLVEMLKDLHNVKR